MDIVVKPSVEYVKYLKVLMISVYENNKDVIEGDGITFWCLHNALEDNHKAEINEIAARYNQKVEYIYVNVHIFDKLPTTRSYPRNVYFTLLIHQFLPKKLHRALYLDIDIVVNGSLKKFYNLPFEDNYLIASRDWYDARFEPEQEFNDFFKYVQTNERDALLGNYFNTGVTLFNLDKLREDNIDINFYNEKMQGKEARIADQSVLNYCFYLKTKILKTCKYNYKSGYSLISWDSNRDNFHYNSYVHYEYKPVDAIIYHYCGSRGFKPWFMYFLKRDINVNGEFKDIYPEYADYIGVWWKYAKLSPDYNLLWKEQSLNKVAYNVLKLITRNPAGCFISNMNIITSDIPNYLNRNIFTKGEDIDRYVKPGIYSCNDALECKIKNLPSDLVGNCGFRLTVKTLKAAVAYAAPLVQELEVADENATLYRRYTKNRDSAWSPWVKVASSDDVTEAVTAFASTVDELKNSIENNSNAFREYEEAQQNRVEQLRKEIKTQAEAFDKQVERHQDSLVAMRNDIITIHDGLTESNKQFSEQISALKEELGKVVNSKSFKIGRFITFIPRKIVGIFKKKK